jgi:23S rRNA (uracil1939-C5)-methyltransferase
MTGAGLNGTRLLVRDVSQIAEVTITGLSHDGRGVGRHEGQVVFVPDLLPGERARVRVERGARGVLNGSCLERLSDSAQRRRPPCILAERCGGCSLQHLRYAAQLDSKALMLHQALARIAQIDLEPLPLISNGQELGYRNRAVIPLERTPEGTIKAGFYRQGSHRIVNMNHCPVLDPRLDPLIAPIKADLEASGWPVDRHLQAEGGLRHLALRVGHHSDDVLITLISSRADLADSQVLAARWMDRWPQVVGVVLNLQPRPSNTLFGPQSEVLAGRSWLRERFCGLDFAIGGDTFFQVNTAQAEAAAGQILAALIPGDGLVVDAYCGVGAFSLPLAAAGHTVLGLELQDGSIELARRNASLNGLEDRCQFQAGPVADHLAAQLESAKAVVVDPPRKGLETAVRQVLIEQPVPRLLYLSCDPATLARDLKALSGEGPYRLESLQPFDFFPNTSHVETLAVLSS